MVLLLGGWTVGLHNGSVRQVGNWSHSFHRNALGDLFDGNIPDPDAQNNMGMEDERASGNWKLALEELKKRGRRKARKMERGKTDRVVQIELKGRIGKCAGRPILFCLRKLCSARYCRGLHDAICQSDFE